jgi:hypothetical protein
MRAVIAPFFALGSCIAVAAPAQTAPVSPHQELSAPAITMVRQRCGQGMKRAMGTQDKQGAWHGPCVPKHAARAGTAARSGDSIADQLNAQEAGRAAGGSSGMLGSRGGPYGQPSPTQGIPGATQSPGTSHLPPGYR